MVREFQCPYCFSTCREDEVLFRATAGYDETTIRFKMSMSGDDEDRSFWRLFEKNSADSPKLSKWVSFWEPRGGVACAKTRDPRWDMPYIDPKDPDFVEMIRATDTGGLQVDADGFVRDEQGFVYRVVDRFNKEGMATQRLCPHCLNPFPLPKYGKYPVCFIGVIGTVGTGKTVYLARLFDQLKKDAARTPFRAGDNNFGNGQFKEFESRWSSHELPAATAEEDTFYPLAMDLVDETGADGVTLIFYDASGFACTDTKETGLSQTSLAFVRHCDALLLVLDPQQVNDAAAGAYKKQNELHLLMEQLNNTCPEGMDRTPVLVVLSKADELETAEIPVQQKIPADAAGIQPYPRKEFYAADQQIRRYIQQHGQTVASILEQIGSRVFFAVSALGKEPVARAWIGTQCYDISKTMQGRLARLRDWIDEWNGMAEEDGRQLTEQELEERHRWLGPCPCELEQELPVSCIIKADMRQTIWTDIVLYSIQGVRHKLTLDEAATMELQLYQNPDAPEQDVEAPLRWILWSKGLLEPYYDDIMMPEQPRRLFTRRVPMEVWADDWNRAWTASRERFFNGEDDYLYPVENFKERYGIQ